MKASDYFDGKNLNDAAILRTLHNAAVWFENGAILETKDACQAIAKAITFFEKAEFQKAIEKGF